MLELRELVNPPSLYLSQGDKPPEVFPDRIGSGAAWCAAVRTGQRCALSLPASSKSSVSISMPFQSYFVGISEI
jgi:hypothetical protein